jgi:uncharacterized coiled-coil DUF342 family protein
MEDVVLHAPMKRTEGQTVLVSMNQTMSLRFRDYPFNFHKEGRLRKYPHMPIPELKEWRKIVAGVGTGTEGRQSSFDAGAELKTVALTDTVSPVTAYKQITKTLNNTKTASPAAIAELEEDLGRTKEQLYKERSRADRAEAKVDTLHKEVREVVIPWRARVDAVDNELRSLKAQHRTAMTEANAEARKTSAGYEARLKEADSALRASQKEVLETNERIMAIWAEMQKAPTASEKRKAPDDGSGSLRKMSRTG